MSQKIIEICRTIAAIGLLQAPLAAHAAPDNLELAISQRQFTPQQLELPAGTRVRLTVRNQDSLPAEFESYDLSREVVVPGGASIHLYVGPLKPGKYQFFNDFYPDAKGWIVVKADDQRS